MSQLRGTFSHIGKDLLICILCVFCCPNRISIFSFRPLLLGCSSFDLILCCPLGFCICLFLFP